MNDRKKRVLFICGSMNQTTQMHQIATELPECQVFFTPHYSTGMMDLLRRLNLLEFTILGNQYFEKCTLYLRNNNLPVDLRGERHDYDLVVTCSDLVLPGNIRHRKLVLVQEGMTDPETWLYRLVRLFPLLPRWLSGTAAMGTSNQFERFCVASEGYRDLFVRKGVDPEKIVVTGIPNFDNCSAYLNNSFPHHDFVLVCTSDTRETYQYENRKKFILKAVEIAGTRKLIFKLHPNEQKERATREIRRHAPGALVYTEGNTEQMIANCTTLITRFSSTVYVGLALGKEVYSDFNVDELKLLTPLQNGSAARNIATVCRQMLGTDSLARGRRGKRHSSPIRRYAEALFPRLST
ncbi:MAG: hypothetical protein OEV30_02710 [Ignavibacteria bacterium]|nr:hypothetical protein [Ignavibacteria bacterium]